MDLPRNESVDRNAGDGAARANPNPSEPDGVVARAALSVEDLLDLEMTRERNETWNKLDKNIKVKKLMAYAHAVGERERLNPDDASRLSVQLLSYLDKKLLQRNRDVTYNRETSTITAIPALEWSPVPRRFTLRRTPKPAAKTRRKTGKIERSDKD